MFDHWIVLLPNLVIEGKMQSGVRYADSGCTELIENFEIGTETTLHGKNWKRTLITILLCLMLIAALTYS